mmetsp:Transcript_100715/g.260178  ORF Transcript_100715/g.260178 Transcript_100715/m.260178 type:complete len:211 (+) Transcript_100715:396-1028(+)
MCPRWRPSGRVRTRACAARLRARATGSPSRRWTAALIGPTKLRSRAASTMATATPAGRLLRILRLAPPPRLCWSLAPPPFRRKRCPLARSCAIRLRRLSRLLPRRRFSRLLQRRLNWLCRAFRCPPATPRPRGQGIARRTATTASSMRTAANPAASPRSSVARSWRVSLRPRRSRRASTLRRVLCERRERPAEARLHKRGAGSSSAAGRS